MKEIVSAFNNQIQNPQGAKVLDVLCLPYAHTGMIRNGTVHHIAVSTSSDANQKIIRESIIIKGLNPTPVIDRTYFHSVYFREPGGILFEIATDPPGFIIDQKEDLGKNLVLPSWLEPVRESLEKVLPKIQLYKNNTDNLIVSDQ